MRKLIMRIRNLFKDYIYEENCDGNMDVVIAILDILIEMTMVVEKEDAECVRKLSAFAKILSSNLCDGIVDPMMARAICDNKITPILNYLDHKYREKDVKSDTEIVRELINLDTSQFEHKMNIPANDNYNSNDIGLLLKDLGIDNVVAFEIPVTEPACNKREMIKEIPHNSQSRPSPKRSNKEIFDYLRNVNNRLEKVYDIIDCDCTKPIIIGELALIRSAINHYTHNSNASIMQLQSLLSGLCAVLESCACFGTTTSEDHRIIKSLFNDINSLVFIE